MTEEEWDARLGIRTCGREDYQEDTVHFPYEPTPYSVLERLSESGFIGKGDRVLDYGCGKGRVPIFLNRRVGCRGIGVEFDEALWRQAMGNMASARVDGEVSFLWGKAERYVVPAEVNRCFFFNPFGEKILRQVLNRILASYYDAPREILLFFYYPAKEQVAFLMGRPELLFVDEVDCRDLFPGNEERERILVFEV